MDAWEPNVQETRSMRSLELGQITVRDPFTSMAPHRPLCRLLRRRMWRRLEASCKDDVLQMQQLCSASQWKKIKSHLCSAHQLPDDILTVKWLISCVPSKRPATHEWYWVKNMPCSLEFRGLHKKSHANKNMPVTKCWLIKKIICVEARRCYFYALGATGYIGLQTHCSYMNCNAAYLNLFFDLFTMTKKRSIDRLDIFSSYQLNWRSVWSI